MKHFGTLVWCENCRLQVQKSDKYNNYTGCVDLFKAVSKIWPENLTLSRTQPLLDPRIILSLDCIAMTKVKYILKCQVQNKRIIYIPFHFSFKIKNISSLYSGFTSI